MLAAVLSPVLGPLLPDWITASITLDATRRLLDILSTTMLTVTTFSLTVITAAHLTAAQTITPRVHRLLREDGRTQTVLRHLHGRLRLCAVHHRAAEPADPRPGRFRHRLSVHRRRASLLVSLAVLRWIQHLTTLGALDQTVRMVEDRARDRAATPARAPPLAAADGRRRRRAGRRGPLAGPGFGYLQTVDLPALDRLVRDRGGGMRLAALPGDWIDRRPAAGAADGRLAQADREELTARLRARRDPDLCA